MLHALQMLRSVSSRCALQRTKDLLSEEQILWTNYVVQTLLPLGLSLVLELQKMHVLIQLR
jgi:hypothetical protein